MEGSGIKWYVKGSKRVNYEGVVITASKEEYAVQEYKDALYAGLVAVESEEDIEIDSGEEFDEDD